MALAGGNPTDWGLQRQLCLGTAPITWAPYKSIQAYKPWGAWFPRAGKALRACSMLPVRKHRRAQPCACTGLRRAASLLCTTNICKSRQQATAQVKDEGHRMQRRGIGTCRAEPKLQTAAQNTVYKRLPVTDSTFLSSALCCPHGSPTAAKQRQAPISLGTTQTHPIFGG